MKKMYILLIIILCTGCFNNNYETIQVIDEEIKNQELVIEKIKVDKVVSTSKNYALIMDVNKKIYIIDSDNKKIGIINNTNDKSIYQINDNGYIYQSINGEDKIYNKNGKEILSSNSNTKYYYGISSNNYLIRKLNDKFRYEVIDVDKNIIIDDLKKSLNIKEDGPLSIIFLGGNIYVISTRENEYLYNIKNNNYKIINGLDYSECSLNITENINYDKCYLNINDDMIRINNNRVLIKEDLTIKKMSKYDIVLDNKYYYNYKDKAIKTFDEIYVKDMTINQVNDGLFKDNKYYLATTKGLMILDKDLNQVGEIKKIGSSIKKITPYGIIVNKESAKRESMIYDFNLNMIVDLGNIYLYELQDFIMKTFIDDVSNDTLPYNIKIDNFVDNIE